MACTSGCNMSTTTTSTTTTMDSVYYVQLNAIPVFINGCAFYFTGPMMAVAFPMTILTFLTFALSPLGTTKTTRVYYAMIAVFNFLSTVFRDLIVVYAVRGMSFITLNTNYWVAEYTSMWACRTLDFVLFSLEMSTNSVYVMLACERCIALYFPLQAASVLRKRNALAAVFLLTAFSLLVCSCTLIGASGYYQGEGVTTSYCSINFTASGMLSRLALTMVLFCWILPTGFSLLFNSLILLKLADSRNSALRFGHQPTSTASASKSGDATVTLLVITGIHTLVYIQMGVFRMMPLLIALNSTAPTVINRLAGFGYPWLVVTHVSNFIVYWNRVKGFKKNVLRLLHCKKPLKTDS